MKLPKINISQNKQLDKEMISQFFESGHPMIFDAFPEIVETGDVDEVVDMEYYEESSSIRARIKELGANITPLQDICETLSAIMDETWEGIESIDIYVGVCPISPRFLEEHSFLLPHYHDLPILLNTAAHELTHFLYFKKFAELFPYEKAETYEFPNANNLLSEILASVIDNDERLRNIIGSEPSLYPHWQNLQFNGQNLQEIFTEIYTKADNFENFLFKSREKYAELDNKYKLTEELIK